MSGSREIFRQSADLHNAQMYFVIPDADQAGQYSVDQKLFDKASETWMRKNPDIAGTALSDAELEARGITAIGGQTYYDFARFSESVRNQFNDAIHRAREIANPVLGKDIPSPEDHTDETNEAAMSAHAASVDLQLARSLAIDTEEVPDREVDQLIDKLDALGQAVHYTTAVTRSLGLTLDDMKHFNDNPEDAPDRDVSAADKSLYVTPGSNI